MILPRNIACIMFDFDGVILDSADIKTEAFYEIYLPFGVEIAQMARNYHIEHQGINRKQKIRFLHKTFLNVDITDPDLENLSQSFSNLVYEKVLVCPFIEGALEFLKHLREKGILTFLLSATPDDELKRICKMRNIDNFFRALYGWPHEKKEVAERLLQSYDLKPQQVLFVGDSVSDYEVAYTLNLQFLGIASKKAEHPFCEKINVVSEFKNMSVL